MSEGPFSGPLVVAIERVVAAPLCALQDHPNLPGSSGNKTFGDKGLNRDGAAMARFLIDHCA